MSKPKYSIDEDTGVEFRDCGAWRNWQLTASGNTLEELLDDAQIGEVDQDGGELDCYALDDAPNDVRSAAFKLIEAEILRKNPK